MKRFFMLVLVAMVSASSMFAQSETTEAAASNKFPFSVKAYAFRGAYLDKNTHFTKFGPIHPAGVHLGFELPSTQQRPWQQYLNNPTFGVGLSTLDFGHDMLGMSVAVYPSG